MHSCRQAQERFGISSPMLYSTPVFGGSLWCLLFCLLFNLFSLFSPFSRGGSGYKSLFNVSCWQNGAAAWVPFVLPQIDLISVQSMSNQCLINVGSMSDQCLINVWSMSVQCLINVRPMSDKCLINFWLISDQCLINVKQIPDIFYPSDQYH